jgi:plastocyanin
MADMAGMAYRKARGASVALAAAAVVLAACGSGGGDQADDAADSSAPAASVTSVTPTDPSDWPQPTDAPVTDVPATDAPVPSTELPSPDTTYLVDLPPQPGAQRLTFEVGPIDVRPGQNNIDYEFMQVPRPEVDGYITRIKPDLRYADGTIPAVDVIHLHHGVWLNRSAQDATRPGLPERFFAAGEEKTVSFLPPGYGYPYKTTDYWVLNYMIHNLWPDPADVWITYEIDFIPADAPEAAGIVPARPIWTDVQNGDLYPVFDVLMGDGDGSSYTFPDDATDPYGPPTDGVQKNEWVVDRDGYLLGTAGHLHPGGLYTDLYLQREGATALPEASKPGATDTAHLYRSDAIYFEPAGAVSWDVAMTATPVDWRPSVKAGDVLSTNATYDTSRASWYESMGIMVLWMAEELAPGDEAVDPFETAVNVEGQITHGPLEENENHGNEFDASYFDMREIGSITPDEPIQIADFVYGQGDMQLGNPVPAVKPGESITFDNLDAPLENGIWHTITSCKAPCTGSTGIAYPLADGEVIFDSGELGFGGPPTAERATWTTPTDIDPGTYTYFCRIHPFMRGAFRIEE